MIQDLIIRTINSGGRTAQDVSIDHGISTRAVEIEMRAMVEAGILKDAGRFAIGANSAARGYIIADPKPTPASPIPTQPDREKKLRKPRVVRPVPARPVPAESAGIIWGEKSERHAERMRQRAGQEREAGIRPGWRRAAK